MSRGDWWVTVLAVAVLVWSLCWLRAAAGDTVTGGSGLQVSVASSGIIDGP